MKRIFLASVLLTMQTIPAVAACFGSPSLSNCYDNNGNSYTVQRLGNTTYLNGTNSQTGSSWSQQTHSYGNMTQHYGTANGQTWQMQQQNLGSMQMYSGTDTNGQHFSYSCDAYGNCF